MEDLGEKLSDEEVSVICSFCSQSQISKAFSIFRVLPFNFIILTIDQNNSDILTSRKCTSYEFLDVPDKFEVQSRILKGLPLTADG